LRPDRRRSRLESEAEEAAETITAEEAAEALEEELADEEAAQ